MEATPLFLIYAILFGVSMKIADLLDEHGMKWFKGDRLLFGVLWGLFGGLMIVSNNLLANFLFAMIIHWILRYRIDYLNHGVAVAIILIIFLYNLPNFTVDWTLFLTILIAYSVHGLLNDASDKGIIKGLYAKYFASNSHYFTVPFILTALNPMYWVVLAVSVLHVISYEITKKIGKKQGHT